MISFSHYKRRTKSFINYLKKYKDRNDYEVPRNKNIMAEINREKVYQQMEKQFADVIRDGVTVYDKQSKSDKVWICWFQGEQNAPMIVKAAMASVKKNLPDRDIVIISDENISDYVQFPDYILEKRKKGIIGPAHFSDLLRIELLCKYGGIWIDATVFCSSPEIPECIKDAPLFVYKVMKLSPQDRIPIVASNWFISAYTNQPILLLTRKLLFEYWKTVDYIDDYFIFHILFALASRRYVDDFNKIPMYNNCSPHTLQFELQNEYNEKRWDEIMKMSCFHKLNHHTDYSRYNNCFYHHIIKEYCRNEH